MQDGLMVSNLWPLKWLGWSGVLRHGWVSGEATWSHRSTESELNRCEHAHILVSLSYYFFLFSSIPCGPCNNWYYLSHVKHVNDDDDDADDDDNDEQHWSDSNVGKCLTPTCQTDTEKRLAKHIPKNLFTESSDVDVILVWCRILSCDPEALDQAHQAKSQTHH